MYGISLVLLYRAVFCLFCWGFFQKLTNRKLLRLQAEMPTVMRNVDIAEREVEDFERVMAQLVADDDRLVGLAI